MFQTEKPTPWKKEPETVKRRCHRCHGSGRCSCRICGGRGQIPQSRNVFGEPNYARCSGCYGNKQTRCASCGGTGFVD